MDTGLTVMPNLVQYPWCTVRLSRDGKIGPWTLNQVQGDEGGDESD